MDSDEEYDDLAIAMALVTRPMQTRGGGGRDAAARLRRRVLAALEPSDASSSDEEDEEEEEEEETEEEEEEEKEYVEEQEEDETTDAAGELLIKGVAYEGLSADDLAWAKRLAKWLCCFHQATIQWATVEDDNSTGKKRHGLVIKLSANVAAWDDEGVAKPLKLVRLREAMDLLRLAVRVKPAVVKALIRRLEGYSVLYVPTFSKYEDELNALTRGVPVELGFELVHSALKTVGLKQRIATFFFDKLTHAASSNNDFMEAWTDLLGVLVAQYGLAECNRRLKAPVAVSVFIDSREFRGAAQWESEQFYLHVLAFAQALHANQQAQKTKLWALDGRHAQLHVDKIELHLRSLYVTPKTCRLVKALMAVGIPVNCTYVSIDPRYVGSDRNLVQSFVQAIGTGEAYVGTSTYTFASSIDARGEDKTDVIQIVTEAMARFDQAVTIDFGGLLKLFDERHNREVIWQRLFSSVLSRDPAPRNVSFLRDFELKSADAVAIRQCASQWREANPGKKLRVEKLHLAMMGSHWDAIVALLESFDDIERLWIEETSNNPMQPTDVLLAALRFPSLRELLLENVIVQSMDIFDPSIPDERLPTKPILSNLELRDVVVRDTKSLHRFIAKLATSASTAEAANPLPWPTKLRRLTLEQKNRTFHSGALFDKDMMVAMHKALLQNSTLEYAKFVVDCEDESATQFQTQFKAHNGRLVKASAEVCRSMIAKARQWAFLSVVQNANITAEVPSALHLIDAHIVKLIFELSAPHAYRQVKVEESFEEDGEDED